jgi:uncharacterized integral membrane protein
MGMERKMLDLLAETPEVYQGQFGEFKINRDDRLGVLIYRAALAIAALCFFTGTAIALKFSPDPTALSWVSFLYGGFCLALGVSLLTIHIYMGALHRLLQAFWLVGCLTSLVLSLQNTDPLPLVVYQRPLTLLGVGFTFAALTGIFFKEAFCFNRLETKFLTVLVPFLLLGHLFGWLPLTAEQILLGIGSALFLIFALRKTWQQIPADIGDKSVFAYLKQSH